MKLKFCANLGGSVLLAILLSKDSTAPARAFSPDARPRSGSEFRGIYTDVVAVTSRSSSCPPISRFGGGGGRRRFFSSRLRYRNSSALPEERPPARGRSIRGGDDDPIPPVGQQLEENAQVTKSEEREPLLPLVIPGTGISYPIMNGIVLSQILLLFASTVVAGLVLTFAPSGGEGGGIFSDAAVSWLVGTPEAAAASFPPLPVRMAEGILGALPFFAANAAMDRSGSDGRAVTSINLNTILMTMAMFGRRRRRRKEDGGVLEASDSDSDSVAVAPESTTSQVIAAAAFVSSVAAVFEEIVFRLQVPCAIKALTGSVILAWLGQGALFGAMHVPPAKSRRPLPDEESRVVAIAQTLNGLWHGTIYVLTGGDIVPCMVAHGLYDFILFVATWTIVNDQLDYAEDRSSSSSSSPSSEGGGPVISEADEAEARRILEQSVGSDDEKVAKASLTFGGEGGRSAGAGARPVAASGALRRMFFAFDADRAGGLTLSDVRRAFAFLFLRDADAPPRRVVDELFDRCLMSRREGRRRGDTVAEEEEDRFIEDDRLTYPEFLRLFFVLKSWQQNPGMRGVLKLAV